MQHSIWLWLIHSKYGYSHLTIPSTPMSICTCGFRHSETFTTSLDVWLYPTGSSLLNDMYSMQQSMWWYWQGRIQDFRRGGGGGGQM